MAEEDNTIPPPPSGNIVMPKNIPPPPSGDVVMPDAQKKSEVVSGENSAQPTSVSTPPVSQPTTPSVESGADKATYQWSTQEQPKQKLATGSPVNESEILSHYATKMRSAKKALDENRAILSEVNADAGYVSNDQTRQLSDLYSQYQNAKDQEKQKILKQIEGLENQPYVGKGMAVPSSAEYTQDEKTGAIIKNPNYKESIAQITPEKYTGKDKSISKVKTVGDAYNLLYNKTVHSQELSKNVEDAEKKYVEARNERLNKVNLNTKSGFIEGMKIASAMNTRSNEIALLAENGEKDQAIKKLLDYTDDLAAMQQKAEEDKVNNEIGIGPVTVSGQGFYDFYNGMIRPIVSSAVIGGAGSLIGAPELGAAYITYDAGQQGFTGALVSKFQELQQTNPDNPQENYDKALSYAKAAGIGGAAVMGVGMGAMGIGRAVTGLSEFAGKSFSEALSEAGLEESGLKGAEKFFATKAKVTAPVAYSKVLKHSMAEGAVFTGAEITKNKALKSIADELGVEPPETFDGAGMMFSVPFIMNTLMHGAGKGIGLLRGSKTPYEKLDPELQESLIMSAASFPPMKVQDMLNRGVENGIISQDQMLSLSKEIGATKKALDLLPDGASYETLKQSVPTIRQIDELMKVKETQKETPALANETQRKIDELNYKLSEDLGLPLNEAEQKDYEKLIEKRDAKDEAGKKKNELTTSEEADINHYEKRIRASDKIKREEHKAAINNLVKKLSTGEKVETTPEENELYKNNKAEVDNKLAEIERKNRSENGEESTRDYKFYKPIEAVKGLVREFKQKMGIESAEGKRIRHVDTDRAMEIADAFEAMQHDPNNPEVKAAYKAFVDETLEQARFLLEKKGLKIEMSKTGDEYASPKEMLDDIRENNHLYVFDSESGFGDTPITDQMRAEHPLLQDSGMKDINGVPMKVNDVFRWVHDIITHSERGSDFSAVGEENAWDAHSRLYSPLARRALTTETRGQNSWTNFGKHMRNPDGSFKPAEGENVKYTPQKVGLLPEKFSMLPEEMSHAGEKVKVEGAPKGNHLNIGMKVGRTDVLLTEQEILDALPKDVKVESYTVIPPQTPNGEPTMSIKTSRKLSDGEMSQLLEDTKQQAIPQLTDGEGVLHDKMRGTDKGWGEFDPELFAKQNGDNLLAPFKEELTPAQKRLAETKEKQRTKVNAFEQKVIDDVNRALPSIAKIVKKITGNDVSLKIHYDNGSWEKAVLESGGNLEDAKRAKGFYLSQDGSIHLNIREVESDTGLHEAFHPILDYIQANDPATIDELFGQLKGVKGAEEIVAKAERNYTGDVTIRKEAITDFIAKVADGQIRLDQTNLDKVKNFISNALKAVGLDGLAEKIAKDVGLDMTNAEDLRQLAKLISGKFKTGEEIRPEELSQESASKDIGPDQRASQTLQFSKTVYGESGFTKEPALDKDKYDKALRGGMPDGSPRIQIVNPKESLSGKKAMATFPDDHFVGELKYKGKTISEGNGGIFYTAKYGDKGGAWASVNETTAKNFAKNANESRKLNNGEGVILLVKGDNLKHQTSFESVSGFVNTLLTKAEDNGDFNQVLGVVKQLYGIHGNIKNAETVQKWFNQYLSGGRAESGQTMKDAKAHFDKMTTLLSKESNDAITKVFRDMGLEGERYYDKTQLKSGKYKVTKKGLENFFIDVFAEDALSGLEPGDVYGAIKFYSDLEVSPKDSKHPSYPFQIRTTDRSPVKLEIFDRAFKAYGENSALTGRESGSTASYGTASYTKPTLQIDPTKMPETPTRSEKIGQYESISRTQQPQFSKGDNIKDTYYEPHMTESKDKKDYVFFHVSEADRKSIERGIDSRKFHSTRTSREEKGLQYGVASFYTKPGDGERMVGGEKYAVHVPKDKVYPMDTDPNGYKAKAEAKIKEGTPFRSEKVKKAMADMAAKDGFQMAVGEWGYDRKGGETETPALRADALVPLKPQKEMAADYKPATTKDIPHPEREALIQQKAISDLAEEMYLEKPNAISEEIRMFGGIRTGEGDAVRPPTPAEFKEMTKGLKGSLAKQAKAIEGKLAQGGPDTFERAADKKIRMAERNKILEEFGDKSEKAKFIFKNWDKIKDNLKSKAKELDITFAGDC